MKLRWSSIPFFSLCILFILSCDSGDEQIVCRLSTLKNAYGIQEYVYNAENKVEAILFHGGPGGETKANLEYNVKGQLTKVISFYVSNPEAFEVDELIYDDHNRPQKVLHWAKVEDRSKAPYRVLNFSHDRKGRLVNRELSLGGQVSSTDVERFEFNNDNNLTKIFSGAGTKESLWLENLSFDTKSKYYGLTPELETLNVYVFLHPPGKNNPLTARVYRGQYVQPVDVTYNVGYDENGRVTSYHVWTLEYGSGSVGGSNPDFDEVTYSCK